MSQGTNAVVISAIGIDTDKNTLHHSGEKEQHAPQVRNSEMVIAASCGGQTVI